MRRGVRTKITRPTVLNEAKIPSLKRIKWKVRRHTHTHTSSVTFVETVLFVLSSYGLCHAAANFSTLSLTTI